MGRCFVRQAVAALFGVRTPGSLVPERARTEGASGRDEPGAARYVAL